MKAKLTKQEVYNIILSEREYQDKKWNEHTTSSGGNHSFEEWILYIEHYLTIAKQALSTKNCSEAYPIASDNMRKVAALAFASIENNGANPR